MVSHSTLLVVRVSTVYPKQDMSKLAGNQGISLQTSKQLGSVLSLLNKRSLVWYHSISLHMVSMVCFLPILNRRSSSWVRIMVSYSTHFAAEFYSLSGTGDQAADWELWYLILYTRRWVLFFILDRRSSRSRNLPPHDPYGLFSPYHKQAIK